MAASLSNTKPGISLEIVKPIKFIDQGATVLVPISLFCILELI